MLKAIIKQVDIDFEALLYPGSGLGSVFRYSNDDLWQIFGKHECFIACHFGRGQDALAVRHQ
jgi:hypothetical protein